MFETLTITECLILLTTGFIVFLAGMAFQQARQSRG